MAWKVVKAVETCPRFGIDPMSARQLRVAGAERLAVHGLTRDFATESRGLRIRRSACTAFTGFDGIAPSQGEECQRLADFLAGLRGADISGPCTSEM
jgi:hypothetical protein